MAPGQAKEKERLKNSDKCLTEGRVVCVLIHTNTPHSAPNAHGGTQAPNVLGRTRDGQEKKTRRGPLKVVGKRVKRQEEEDEEDGGEQRERKGRKRVEKG